MRNAILIQQIYPDTEGVKLLELTEKHHAAYCEKWDMDYRCVYENALPESDPLKGSWSKVELIRHALGECYDYVIWLDADTLIKDFDTDLRDACIDGIGACWQRIPQLHHWNVGALYMKESFDVINFIEKWLACYPGFNDGWNEQGVFNKMAMEGRIVQTISDRWNATLNYSMVPDAVVLGYHGYGTTQERYDAMQVTLKRLEAREGVR